MEKEILLSVRGLTKSFPGVKALDAVSFDVKRGSIHALVGENGAGKSTLIKILAGIYHLVEGTLTLDGKDVNFATPIDASMAGISVVHQELKLSEPLTVAENIFLGNLLYNKLGLVDWRRMRSHAREMIHSLGIDIGPDEIVGSLSVAKKQMVEICKAINRDARLLIMDEPSATLTEREQNMMFSAIKKLNDAGMTIIYISHRLDEIFNLCDTVTVLRDGRMIDTLPVADVDRVRLISMMVGRDLINEYPKEEVPIGDVCLEVKGLTRKGVIEDISFYARQGEIVGFSGLVGSGRTEVMRAMLGVDKIDQGQIILNGKQIQNKTFIDAINKGFGLVPEDRRGQGLVQIATIKVNASMVSLWRFLRFGFINGRRERSEVTKYTNQVNLVAPSLDTEIQYLSGGNQQKVVIAKWLMEQSKIYVLDEPTRGVDVGAKTEIYKLITALIKNGNTVIIVSSEMPEILGMCDRIYVMHEGRLAGELSREEATQEKIMALCT